MPLGLTRRIDNHKQSLLRGKSRVYIEGYKKKQILVCGRSVRVVCIER